MYTEVKNIPYNLCILSIQQIILHVIFSFVVISCLKLFNFVLHIFTLKGRISMTEPCAADGNSGRRSTISVDNAVIQDLAPGFFFSTHFHQTAELVLCTRGQITLNIQKEAVTASPGEYILCFPNIPHSTAVRGETAAEMMQIHFNVSPASTEKGSLLSDPSLFNFEIQLGERRYLKGICSDQLRACISGIYEEVLNRETNSNDMLYHYTCQLDTLLSRDLEADHEGGSVSLNRHLITACTYIKRHYAERLTVPVIARACNVSARYLSRLFHDYLQLSVCSYITHVRINRSIEIMRANPDYPLISLALELGFSSQQHFSTVFRESMSISPKKYIALHQDNI